MNKPIPEVHKKVKGKTTTADRAIYNEGQSSHLTKYIVTLKLKNIYGTYHNQIAFDQQIDEKLIQGFCFVLLEFL